MPLHCQITVTTKSASYPIHIGSDLDEALACELESLRSNGSQLAILTDASVRKELEAVFAGPLKEIPMHIVPAGEKSKSIDRFSVIMDFLAEVGIDRKGVLIAVGGGVVGDLGGFAASAYLRGIRFIQIPTTLLAMVDSSVGGKTGVNIEAGKNLVGAFHQPISVYIDTNNLNTLPPREFKTGMAEVIKYGLLGDAEFFNDLEANPIRSHRDPRLADTIKLNCQIKADIVNADEMEQASNGGRALLNLGHTFAHAIENVAGYGEYLHGEAVAIGLCAAANLSMEMGLISETDNLRIKKTVSSHGLPAGLRSPLSLDRLVAAMYKDKKASGGSIRFVVMNGIGNAETSDSVDMNVVADIWRALGAG